MINTVNEISDHAGERYCERFKGQTEFDSKAFYIYNKEKITDEIMKMMEYAELIYHGPLAAFPSRRYYLQGQNILVASDNGEIFITLFQTMFGNISSETNSLIFNAVKEELMQHISELQHIQTESATQIKDLNENISESEQRIQDLKKEIDIEREVIEMNKTYINYQKGMAYQKSVVVRDVFKTILGRNFGIELSRKEEK